MPSASDRFDSFEVRHGIGMTAEVNVLPFHILHLTDKVQIIHIRPMLLCGHADLAAALVHFVNDGVLRFQLVHTVGKCGVVLVGIQQIHHNITVDLRKGVLNAGWQIKIKELINNIECAQSAPELVDVDLRNTTLNTGLLLIHANDKFDQQKFYDHLSKIAFPNRRNPINIFIAANDRIAQWTSLFAKVKTSYNNGFSFIYPSINESNKISQKSLTINALYSKYLLGCSTYNIQKDIAGNTYQEPHTQNMLFFFDEITPESQGSRKVVRLFGKRNRSECCGTCGDAQAAMYGYEKAVCISANGLKVKPLL